MAHIRVYRRLKGFGLRVLMAWELLSWLVNPKP